jgi:iron complex transport system ATP-binding protein
MTDQDALSAQGVSVVRGPRTILQDITFGAGYGGLLAIAGPNGAGKSTLLKTLLGLMPCTGSIQVEGRSLIELSDRERAQRLAYIPQRASVMLGVSVLDVVASARYAHRDRWGRIDREEPTVHKALARVGLTDLAGRTFESLSGGEQRLVLLARALATGARVLLFDEPTAGLDIVNVLHFFRLMRELVSQGHAVLCVLHELSDVQRYADEVLLLASGRCVEVGPVARVLSPQRISQVYGVHVHPSAALGFSLDGSWP